MYKGVTCLQALVDRARRIAPAFPQARLLAALMLLAVLAAAGLTVLFSIVPRYQVWYGQELVGSSRDLAALADRLGDWAHREMEREINLAAEGKTWTYQLSELGLVIAPEDLDAALRAGARELPWWQRLAWSRPSIKVQEHARWDLQRLTAALTPVVQTLSREPVPAELRIENQIPVIQSEVVGQSVEPQVVLQALQSLGTSAELQVPVTTRLPAVTRSSLEQLRIRKLVAELTTHYDPSIPRADNVEKAAAAFDGVMLRPGEILSYNATVGPINTATGWKQAYVIVAGELVEGVGGGVCQVATTLYGAALRANLEIMERHPHQLAVPYVPASQDAAIAQGWEDLKLRNTTLGHLLIRTETGGGAVTFRLYGDLPDDQEVKIESRVLGQRPFPTRLVADGALAPGQQRIKLYGSPGLSSEGYRLVYRGGVLVKRELLSRDNYLPSTQVVLTGPSAAPAPEPPAAPELPGAGENG